VASLPDVPMCRPLGRAVLVLTIPTDGRVRWRQTGVSQPIIDKMQAAIAQVMREPDLFAIVPTPSAALPASLRPTFAAKVSVVEKSTRKAI